MLVTTLGISRMVEQFHMEIKRTWHGPRYAIVQHKIQQERKGVRWVEVAREKETVSLPMYPCTPEGHARCKDALERIRKQKKEDAAYVK